MDERARLNERYPWAHEVDAFGAAWATRERRGVLGPLPCERCAGDGSLTLREIASIGGRVEFTDQTLVFQLPEGRTTDCEICRGTGRQGLAAALALLVYCGHEPARALAVARGVDLSPGPASLLGFVEGLDPWGQEVMHRAMLAMLWVATHHDEQAQEGSLARQVLALARVWTERREYAAMEELDRLNERVPEELPALYRLAIASTLVLGQRSQWGLVKTYARTVAQACFIRGGRAVPSWETLAADAIKWELTGWVLGDLGS